MSNQSRFQAAVSAALAGATVVTANTRAGRAVRSACESSLFATKKVWRTPDILPFESWLVRLWQEWHLSGHRDLAMLRPVQEWALWDLVVSESARRSSLLNKAGAASCAADAWRLIHRFNIPLSDPAFQTKPETIAFLHWAQAFSSVCTSRDLIDSARLPDALASRLSTTSGLLPKQIFLFGFDELTPQQRQFLIVLKSAGVAVDDYLPDEDLDVSGVRGIPLADSSTELRAAARWAQWILEEDSTVRIGVVVPNLDELRTTVEHIFIEVLHPEFFIAGAPPKPLAFDVSAGPSLADYPLIRTALLTLQLVVESIEINELGVLLRSPYLDHGTEEASRRAIFDSYLRAKAGDMLTLRQVLGLLNHLQGSQYGCPKLQRLFSQLVELAAELPQQMAPSAWTRHVAKLLGAAGWPGNGEGGRLMDSVEFQAHHAWCDLLSEYSTLDLIVESESQPQLCSRIRAMASRKAFRPENNHAPVQVLGHLEASGSVFDHLWVVGLSDDVWPVHGYANACIPMALQREAGVPHCTPGQELAFARLVTARLVRSATDVVMSWPKHEEDRDLRASPLLTGVKLATEEELCGPPTPGWTDLQGDVAFELYQDEIAPVVSPSEVAHRGTSLLELQSNCPFRAFIENRLAGSELETPRMGLNPRVRGMLVEKTLELVWRELHDHATLENIARADLELIVARSADDAIIEIWRVGEEPWQQRYRDLERVRLINLTHEWLEVEKRREPFEVMEYQIPIEVELAGLIVRGVVDRIDRLHDGSHVIIDYKSGAGPYSPAQWAVPRPEKPQLPFYVVSELEKNNDVSAVAYAHVRTGECGLSGYGTRKEILGLGRDMSAIYFGAATFTEHITKWKPELERLITNFLGGNAEVDPRRPPTESRSPCNRCSLPALCHVAQCEDGGNR